MKTRGLTARQLFEQVLRVPQRGRRTLGPLVLHAEQARLIDAWDAIDVDGAPVYDELFCYWQKKTGKSTTTGGLVLHELIAGRESDREILLVSSDLDQSKDITFASVARFVDRHPWLRQHVTCGRTEVRYRETLVDPRTGGRHVEEHVIRAIPARDAKSLHGSNATLTTFDEYWTQSTYDVVEALGRSPARQFPRVLYASYAGLRSSQRAGNPLWDLHQRWKRGDDPRLFVSYIGGPDGWRSVPWLTAAFMEQERRRFEAVPAKFKRLYLNEWASGDEGTFLTAVEIAEATDAGLAAEPVRQAGMTYSIGGDLGLTHDLTALALSHVDLRGCVVVDAVRSWQGTRATPVDLSAVEAVLVEWASQFNAAIHLDQWQGAFLAQRLQARGFRVTTHTVETARLDNYASLLKTLFKNRHVRIPDDPTLIEQLETIEGQELARRDRVRFTSGPGGHDDLVMAICLSVESFVREVRGVDGTTHLAFEARTVGRRRMEDISVCRSWTLMPSYHGQCPLVNVPSANPGCASCAAFASTERAHAEHRAAGGAEMTRLAFIRQHMVRSPYIEHLKFDLAMANYMV
jgi:phage terminase large subunit-like protein